MDKIRINTEKAQKEFLKHLQIEGNERIIFSGQFGIGKTTFLKEFKEAHKNKYRIFHLFPINYSVASNEDIFELVKYDLFYEVLEYVVEEKKTDLLVGLDMTKKEFLPFFLAQNWNSVGKSFLKFIPKVGKSIADFVEEYEKLKNLFDSKLKEFNKSHGDLIRVFSEGLQNKAGQLYEFDQFSEILKELIKDLNSEDNRKENVLIIDDLDRVDPDHLFRLLNVFAAHVDFDKENSNKFGFDRVVFVLDIKNVRRIFENRYGQGVDFSGYIDKFFSNEVFSFESFVNISESIDNILLSIRSDHRDYQFNSNNEYIYSELKFLLLTFFKVGALNLRALFKLENWDFSLKNHSIIYKEDYNKVNTSLIIQALIFDIMTFVLGTSSALSGAISKCIEFSKEDDWIKDPRDKKFKEKISFLLVLLGIESNDYSEYYSDNNKLTYQFEDIKITYQLNQRNYYLFTKSIEILDMNGFNTELTPHIYFKLLSEAYQKYSIRLEN